MASTIDSLIISGLPHPDAHRDTVLLSSLDTGRGSGGHLLAVKFETSPLDSDFDQIVNLSAQPVEIIYDAVSGWWIMLLNVVAEYSILQISGVKLLYHNKTMQ